MFGRNSSVELLKKIMKLDAVEFLGVCKILGVSPYKGNPNDPKSLEPRNFTELWSDLCDKVNGLNRTRRKNLNKLVSAAVKKGE